MQALNRQQFAEKYAPMAVAVTAGTSIFPETALAIAIIETQRELEDGNYYPGQSTLVKRANNYFGIKADAGWKGAKVQANTPGDAKKISYFRKYYSAEESFRDFVKFLESNKRYKTAGVLNSRTYQDQIINIARAGYAEGSGYASKLNSIAKGIQKYTSAVDRSVDAGEKLFPVLFFGLVFSLALIIGTTNEKFRRTG